MSQTCVIVQARLGSSRLPGKVLADLAGKTTLARVLERCHLIRGADSVYCAVPAGAADDGVAEEAARCGATVVRGSENDVLDRYYQAAMTCQADALMRVTSDCPLLDPYLAAEVLQLVVAQGADYACNNVPRTWPHGLDCEAFRFAWLERAWREAREPYDREHVTPYIRNHQAARKLTLTGPGPPISLHRWTLDTPKDLEFMRALFKRMPAGPDGFSYTVPLAVVERDPDLAKINVVSS